MTFNGKKRKEILLVTEQQNLKPVSKPLKGRVKYLCWYRSKPPTFLTVEKEESCCC
jgi:hypothetical protein